MGYYLLAVPVFWNIDDASVRTYVVVLGRNCRRLLVEMSAPSEAYVHIFRITESVHLPVAWNIHGLPFGVIKIFLVEVGRTLVGVLHPLELSLIHTPSPRDRQKSRMPSSA